MKNERIIAVYEKYLDRIWKDLSKDDKVRLETHFGGIINEIDEIVLNDAISELENENLEDAQLQERLNSWNGNNFSLDEILKALSHFNI